MTFLATPPREQRQSLQVLADTPGDPAAFEPGFFQGAGTAVAVGLGRVTAVANQLAGAALSPYARALVGAPVDALFDTDTTGWITEKFDTEPARLTASMTPDPATTGFLGQVLYGLVGVGVPAVAGAYVGGPVGAAVGAGAFDATGTATDLEAQGVDPATARLAGATSGLFTGLGVGAPAAIGGRVALSTLLYGPGINVAQDIAARQSIAGLLDARGYTELGDHYAEIEAQNIAADVVLGAGFGWASSRGVPRGTVRRPLTGDVDSAQAALARQNVELDTAPGIAADAASLKLHVRNLGKATEALLAGKPVTAEAGGTFAPKPTVPAHGDAALVAAFKESGYPELLAEVAGLEADLAARGRIVADEPLPDVPVAAPEASAPRPGHVGHVTDVKIGDEYAAARWEVREADAVAPTVAVAENQLRDRTRAASELQVNEIAAKLDPRLLLADVPVMDLGAPTLTADGTVVAGNGRAMAIRKAYGAGERGQAYRTALVERAAALGLDPAAVAGMKEPVLVRVLQQGVDVQRAAILSNEGGAARMSALEQSRVDAGRLPNLAALELPEDGDFGAASARDFVRGWIGQFPETQRASLLNDSGELSPEGRTRLQNALLFRAYGDTDTLRRLVDSLDPGSRNVAAALLKAAPKVAEVKDGIARGELYPLDLAPEIVRAADLVEQIRGQGLTVGAWIDQLDMFSPGETPATLALLKFIDANKRSSRALANVLTDYYDGILAAGNPGQGSLLGAGAPDPVTLLSNAIARAAPGKAAAIVQDTLFRPFKTRAELTPESAIRGADLDAENFGMPAPARTIPDGDPLLQPHHEDTSPERVAMRAALVEQRFAGKEGGQAKPVALVMGGGGASGKGTVLGRLKKAGIVPKGAVELDPDSFKTGNKKEGWGGIPEYRDIVERGDSRAAAVVHDESSLLYKQGLARAIDGKYDVVLDRTFGDPAKAIPELQALRDAGYEIRLVGVTVEVETAIGRAVKRAEGPEKRFVPIKALLEAHKGFAQAWEQYAVLAHHAMLLDNEVPKGADPKPLAGRAAGGKLEILNEKGYISFGEKGNLNDRATTLRELQGTDSGGKPGSARPVDARGIQDSAGSDRGSGPGARSGNRAGAAAQGADDLPGGLDPPAILAERPDLQIATPDGFGYAADVYAAAELGARRAKNDAPGFEAAVACFLRSAA